MHAIPDVGRRSCWEAASRWRRQTGETWDGPRIATISWLEFGRLDLWGGGRAPDDSAHVARLSELRGRLCRQRSLRAESAAPHPFLTRPIRVIWGARCGLGIAQRIYLSDQAPPAQLDDGGTGAADSVGLVGQWIAAAALPPFVHGGPRPQGPISRRADSSHLHTWTVASTLGH